MLHQDKSKSPSDNPNQMDLSENSLPSVNSTLSKEQFRDHADDALATALVTTWAHNADLGWQLGQALGGVTSKAALQLLTEALLNSPQESVKHHCVSALEGTNDPDAIAALVLTMKDSGDLFIRTACARALSGSQSLEIQTALLDASLEKRNRELPLSFLERLIGTPHPQIIEKLISSLKSSKNADFKEGCARALKGSSDPHALAVLVEQMLTSDVHEVKRGCSYALKGTVDPTTVKALLERLGTKEEHWCDSALAATGLGDPKVENRHARSTYLTLFEAMKAGSYGAACALRDCCHEEIMGQVRKLLRKEGFVQHVAAAFDGTTDLSAQRELLKIIKNPSCRNPELEACVRALRNSNDREIASAILEVVLDHRLSSGFLQSTADFEIQHKYLAIFLRKGTALDMRIDLATALVGTEHLRIVDKLLKHLRTNEDPFVRACCASALANSENSDVVLGLVRSVETEKDALVKVASIHALAGSKNTGAQTALFKQLTNKGKINPNIRLACANSLRGVIAPALEETIAAEMAKNQDKYVIACCAAALGQSESPFAYQALIRALQHDDPSVVIYAARSLSRKEPALGLVLG